jgi:hypothetical protein
MVLEPPGTYNINQRARQRVALVAESSQKENVTLMATPGIKNERPQNQTPSAPPPGSTYVLSPGQLSSGMRPLVRATSFSKLRAAETYTQLTGRKPAHAVGIARSNSKADGRGHGAVASDRAVSRHLPGVIVCRTLRARTRPPGAR